MGMKSRLNFKVDGCHPNEHKCKKCVYNDECAITMTKDTSVVDSKKKTQGKG